MILHQKSYELWKYLNNWPDLDHADIITYRTAAGCYGLDYDYPWLNHEKSRILVGLFDNQVPVLTKTKSQIRFGLNLHSKIIILRDKQNKPLVAATGSLNLELSKTRNTLCLVPRGLMTSQLISAFNGEWKDAKNGPPLAEYGKGLVQCN